MSLVLTDTLLSLLEGVFHEGARASFLKIQLLPHSDQEAGTALSEKLNLPLAFEGRLLLCL